MTRIAAAPMEQLRELVLRMASHAEAILDKSIRAIRKRDAELGGQVQTDDLEIDRLDVSIDDQVLEVLALQAPMAHALREVFAIKMVATDLERVGDLARNLGQAAVRSAERTGRAFPARLEELAAETRRSLRLALDSFSQNDTRIARAVLEADDRIDQLEAQVIQEQVAALTRSSDSAAERVDFILMATHLERVADHATNIAEDVILVAEARNVKHASKLDACVSPPEAHSKRVC